MINNVADCATLQAENAALRQRVADLEQREQYLRQIFAQLTDVVLVFNDEGTMDLARAGTSTHWCRKADPGCVTPRIAGRWRNCLRRDDDGYYYPKTG